MLWTACGLLPLPVLGEPWDPARLPGLPKSPLASSTHISMLFSKPTDRHRNIGTAGFADRRGLQQPLKGTELTLFLTKQYSPLCY